MSNAKEGTTVTVTSKGQATIPKEFREKLHIDTPGRVRFIENEDGDVMIRPVRRPSEIRGDLATSAIEDEQSATELLREERERDRKELDEGRITAESDE
jgi:AbrB family looped-hinge helix DNA binding protein